MHVPTAINTTEKPINKMFLNTINFFFVHAGSHLF